MEIRREILARYLTQAAIEQLAEEYKHKNYEVVTDAQVNNVQPDLIARRGDETVVFEIKAGEWGEEERRAFLQVRNYAIHQLNADFRLVLVEFPEEPDIVVDSIHHVLDDYLLENYVDEFSRLATHHWIEEISEAKYRMLYVEKDKIEARGSATLTLGLQFGSDRDNTDGFGSSSTESFPFKFHVILNPDLSLRKVVELEVVFPNNPE